ncbi:MAG: 1-acyl-sn-glycerol-3-phosphate acyltransferase [Azonexus sp.]|nr:1-acyl-sn-glycerol-3-phosphate acyltransferase [Azonexus sp.]
MTAPLPHAFFRWCFARQRDALLVLVRLIIGAYPVRYGKPPEGAANLPDTTFRRQKIYFSNHASHLDTLAILAALPREARSKTRPIAARDYWDKSGLRRYGAQRLLNAALIDRLHESEGDPLDPVREALREGSSIIIFPEGTRGSEWLPQTFKSGLFRLASEFPDIPLTPIYLENLQRIMPKGAFLPVPLICKVHFGPDQTIRPAEDKTAFLERMRAAVADLAPWQTPPKAAEAAA